MSNRREVDDAVEVAVDRTRDAQGRVIEELDERGAPQSATTDTVVRRAEDLGQLVREQDRRSGDDEQHEAPERA